MGTFDQKLMAVPVRGGDTLEFGAPQELFKINMVEGTANRSGLLQQYDISPDGQRFLMNIPAEDTSNSPTITVVLNWQAGLKQ